jgi:hypothetical protein
MAKVEKVSACRRLAEYLPGRVFLVVSTPNGAQGICSLAYYTRMLESAGWEVLYSTFSGACAVC